MSVEKVLFLGDPSPNHGIDTFFHGLCEVFGDANVHQFPIEVKFNSDYNYDPYNFWTVKNTPTDNQSPYVYWNHYDWVREFNNPNSEFKYIICVFQPTLDNWMYRRYPAVYSLCNLLRDINPDNLKNICVSFIEDSGDPEWHATKQYIDFFNNPKIPNFSIYGDIIYSTRQPILNNIDVWLKNDFNFDKNPLPDKIFPFYISAPSDKLLNAVDCKIKSFDEKEIDVLYLVGNSHPDRIKYYNILKDNLKIGNNIIHCGLTLTSNLKEYFQLINNSKIIISIRGSEPQNCRNVEGPFFGAALFSQELNYNIPNPYIHGESCIYFNETNLIEQLNYYITNKDKLKELMENSHIHCLTYHTTKSRAEQFKNLAKIKKGW